MSEMFRSIKEQITKAILSNPALEKGSLKIFAVPASNTGTQNKVALYDKDNNAIGANISLRSCGRWRKTPATACFFMEHLPRRKIWVLFNPLMICPESSCA